MNETEIIGFLIMCLLFALMMLGITVTYNLTISGGGLSAVENVSVTGSGQAFANPTCPAAKSGTLTTRTSGTAGVITASGHSIVVGARVDVYWDVGGVEGSAYGGIVSAVGATTITFAGLSGDALPIATSTVIIAKAQVDNFGCDGDDIVSLVAKNNAQRSIFTYADAGGDIYSIEVGSGAPFYWKTGDVDDNPLAGEAPTKVWISSAKLTEDTGSMTHAITEIAGTGTA